MCYARKKYGVSNVLKNVTVRGVNLNQRVDSYMKSKAHQLPQNAVFPLDGAPPRILPVIRSPLKEISDFTGFLI